MTVVARRRPPPMSDTTRRFWAFHEANPIVYETLLRLARHAMRKGARRIGIRMLWERMRWELDIELSTTPGEKYALNDHYTSRYVRLLMRNHPELKGLFETRGEVDL